MANGRDAWIAGQGRRNVEDARRKAAANTPQVLMSQTPEWYKDRENLSRTKDVLQHIPAVTTDQNEKRNMYQMLMNQMKGGDKGARLIDTSGLPAGARRIGRTLFTDPAKSQGFFGDVKSLFTGKNAAAVRAKEYNPFPIAGFGEKYYKDEFGGFDLSGLMEGIMKIAPYTGTLSKFLPKKERIPLERDPRFTPIPGSADWESSVFDINDIIPQKGIAPLVPEHIQKSTLWGINQDKNEGKGIFYGGRGELPPDFDYEDDREGRELSAKIAFLESIYPHIDYDNVDPSLIDEAYERAMEGKQGTEIEEEEVIPEIITEGEGNVSEIFENSEIFNKNYGLSTSYGEVLPETYAPGTTAYSLFQQLKEGFTNMSDDEILQKMIDNDMIKERL